MAFVDEAKIHVASGDGGSGVIRWLRTKESARGGPSGGDGGRGGDVVLRGVRDLAALARFRYEKSFHAENGEAGKGELKHGKNGDDCVIDVPMGTVVEMEDAHESFEITYEGEEHIVYRGGKGGLGNARFKSATNQNPFQQTQGKKGKGGDIKLTLKIIADAGLIGLPNAGKSSLMNALTRSKSKVGAYPFTTLEPHLGEFHGYILADIPGLIEGASAGRGLGTKFLRHVERTGILLHLVSAEQDDPIETYREVRSEIESFASGLAAKREIIIVSKTDLLDETRVAALVSKLRTSTGKEVLTVSIIDDGLVKMLSDTLISILQKS